MDFAIATMSSKGQIVIPKNLRSGMRKGDEFLFVRDGERIIMKLLKDMTEKMKDDLQFAQHVEEAWQRHDRGEFITMSKDEFLKELKKW